MLRRGMSPWEAKPRWCDRTHSSHLQTAPFCPPPFPPSTPLRAPHGLGGDIPPYPMTKCHRRHQPPGFSDMAAQGVPSAKCEEAGGQGGAKQARGPN